jgi:CRP-like cAMP-binding protein
VPLGKNAKVDLIKQVPLFSDCSKRQLAEIAAVCDEMHFDAGATLITQGAVGREFVVVVEGDVEVRKSGRKVQRQGDADFFGEMALLTDEPRSATVTTTTPVRALVLTDRAFRRVLKDSPAIQLKVLTALASRIADSER